MSHINKAILKVAQNNPEFRKALQAELKKTARAFGGDKIAHILEDNFQDGLDMPSLNDAKRATAPREMDNRRRLIDMALKKLAMDDSVTLNDWKMVSARLTEFAMYLGWKLGEQPEPDYDPSEAAMARRWAADKKAGAGFRNLGKLMLTLVREGADDLPPDNQSEVWAMKRKLNSALDAVASNANDKNVWAAARALQEFLTEAGLNTRTF